MVPNPDVVPNPVFPKAVLVPNNGLAVLVAVVPPNSVCDEGVPNPKVGAVDVAVPKVNGAAGFAPKDVCELPKSPVPLVPTNAGNLICRLLNLVF